MLTENGVQIPRGRRVIALGFFDGVHIGHREIFRTARAAATAAEASFAIFTFPTETEGIKSGDSRLTDTEQKLAAFRECGADEVILADFEKMRDIAAEDFVRDFLIEKCGAVACVSGEDYRFGREAKGNVQTLSAIIGERGGQAITVPDVTLDGVRVSTSAIKEALRKGETHRAERMLGAPYSVRGRVEHGRGVGRALGYPTVNLSLGTARGVLRRGVYSSHAVVRGEVYPAVTNVGVCPTYGDIGEHAESYILGDVGNIYGEQIEIRLGTFLRDEIAFSSENELKMQINIDINQALKEFFGK